MKQYLAIDIGGTYIKYSLMDPEYRVLHEGSTPTEKLPAGFLRQFMGIVETYVDQISGVAICMGGFIHPVTGENTDFSVGANFRAYRLKEEINRKYPIPVVLENDSNCAALGEMVRGAGRGFQDICMVTFGTGIGGAIIINRELYRGSHFKSGEVGFTRVCLRDVDGKPAAEGAGATSLLVRKVSEILGREVDGTYIFNHLDHPDIDRVYREWLYKGAMVIGNFAVTVDPKILLIGGGISENEIFIRDMKEAVYALYPHLEPYTAIEACEQGNMAGRMGALYLLLQSGEGGVQS
ncbi:MAG TPA: hypothetical protein DEQ64_12195 [Lachnoclostridium sp.]|uniref:ROK family protein n=1 Tax=Lacrimispora sp. TaxID=2719234 RepID=UPI000EC59F21|nr:ROK family protein [Lacrimispora sp.]HCD44472.1 hypothetical protein [Lachnoclostridium sp.]